MKTQIIIFDIKKRQLARNKRAYIAALEILLEYLRDCDFTAKVGGFFKGLPQK